MTANPELRIGDAERDAAVTSLGEHFAAGRLTREEFDERSDQVVQARTQSQLNRLFTDLPQAHPTPGADRSSDRGASSAPAWFPRIPWVPILLVLVGIAVITHFPFLPLVFLGLLWFFGPLRHGWRPHRYHS
ncbi:hypothetical protein BH20ACT6_BH20ACT6_13030 [soil metagenome]